MNFTRHMFFGSGSKAEHDIPASGVETTAHHQIVGLLILTLILFVLAVGLTLKVKR